MIYTFISKSLFLFNNLLGLSLSSTIGTPSFKEWPPETPISHKHFKVVPSRSWIDILPRMCQDAQDLLSVSIHVHVQCII